MHLMAFIDPQRMREDGPMLEDLLRRLAHDWDIRSSLVLPEDLSEDLHSVQKQFLGMGPRNVRAVQASLLDIARELGIDPDDLPTPEVVR